MANIYDMADTWNAGGTTFAAIKMNVTDTASAAGSRLLDLQVGGGSRFWVGKLANSDFGFASTASHIVSKGIFAPGSDNAWYGVHAGNIMWGFAYGYNVFGVTSDKGIGWGSGNISSSAPDVILYRGGQGVLSQRNGTNPQKKEIYYSYTDSNNYTRLALKTAMGLHTIEAESSGTGETNIDLGLVPKGSGNIRFGTHSAVASEIVTGYVTIKDAAGSLRKLAVVS